jgi:hypothetical protein
MKHPINLHFIAIALPANVTLADSGLMDELSDLRDNGKILEWAAAYQPGTGSRGGRLVDGESDEMIDLFDSGSVSPSLNRTVDTD